ncbi:MAG: endolytic transglycosylase MltG [Oscillospiraceae bacterium]|nr:endolytic transglycosylase MltG [Oscillospiraceae bacterium]
MADERDGRDRTEHERLGYGTGRMSRHEADTGSGRLPRGEVNTGSGRISRGDTGSGRLRGMDTGGRSESIDRIFQLHEDELAASRKLKQTKPATGYISREEREWADGQAASQSDDQEARYHPIQPRGERRIGCMGGIMYAVFVMCLSIILASLAWMAASDALALNKEEFTATVVLPESIFTTETVEVKDEDGNVTGMKRVSHADMEYISSTLHQAGLIQYPWLFEMYCKVAHADEKVRAGEYKLQSTYDYRALVQNLRTNTGGAVTVNVTFTEGMTMQEMFIRLERQGVSSYENLMKAAAGYHFNYDFLGNNEEEEQDKIEVDTLTEEEIHDRALRLEGFLFPDTYNFYVNMQASSAINKFLEQFNNHLQNSLQPALEESPLSLQQVVTVASMIEKEAADDEERAAIASVIYNRILADMNLGIDATILYVHPDHEGAPTAEMLEEKSPYNTRLNRGLPPTPICNPGLQSLLAALKPAETDYFYYALDTETGRHRFFVTAEEFLAFVSTQNY